MWGVLIAVGAVDDGVDAGEGGRRCDCGGWWGGVVGVGGCWGAEVERGRGTYWMGIVDVGLDTCGWEQRRDWVIVSKRIFALQYPFGPYLRY